MNVQLVVVSPLGGTADKILKPAEHHRAVALMTVHTADDCVLLFTLRPTHRTLIFAEGEYEIIVVSGFVPEHIGDRQRQYADRVSDDVQKNFLSNPNGSTLNLIFARAARRKHGGVNWRRGEDFL